jgi:hypothetical protein
MVAPWLLLVAGPTTPEREQRWAYELLERVMTRVQHEFAASEHGPLFEALKVFLLGEGQGVSYADVAAQQGLSEGALNKLSEWSGGGDVG